MDTEIQYRKILYWGSIIDDNMQGLIVVKYENADGSLDFRIQYGE